jgi:S1-C subfamily serine protease
VLVVVVVVAVVTLVSYVIRMLNRSGDRSRRVRPGSAAALAQARLRDGSAAREALAYSRSPEAIEAARSQAKPLGVTFSEQPTSDSVGVAVVSVTTGSAADRIGVRVGATITAIGGLAVHDIDSANEALTRQFPGRPLSVDWNFDGQESRADVIL